MAIIKLPPELLRMHLNITVSASDAKEALTKAQTRRDGMIQLCKSLGAIKNSIVSSHPRITPDSQQRQQALAQIRQRAHGAATKKLESLVNVTIWVTAEWPLPVNDPGELVVASYTLCESIKSGIAKLKAKTEVISEDQEIQDEIEGQVNQNSNESKPGVPIFLFVAKIPPEAIVKALADASVIAKNRAESLCKAAGGSRGDLLRMTDTDVANNNVNAAAQVLFEYNFDNPGTDIDNRTEAIGVNAGDVSRSLQVDATFRIGK